MIHEPPLLTIRRQFPRPRAEDLAGFAGVQTGHAVDAMGGRGALDYRIKPLAPLAKTLVGVAVTCKCGPNDNLGLFAALDVVQPGDIIVAAADGFTGAAVAGDLVVGMMRNKGVQGFVTDGLVRDVAGILPIGIPVYCAGVTPNSPDRNGPATVGLPVLVAGVPVESGDVVIGDGDGLVIIPQARIAKALAALSGVRAAETALEAKVRDGLGIPDFALKILRSDRVIEIE